ncbi:MAG: DUF805 domain-containing protein [Planctomycetota bacterium]|nr:DUF805 domain-containing protein [Planctomycetota bacterium]
MTARSIRAGGARPSVRRPRRRRASEELLEAYLDGVRRFATFSGRSNRTRFFTFVLVNLAISELIATLEVAAGARVAAEITFARAFQLAVLLPTLAVWARRMHDLGRTAWWLLLLLTPWTAMALFVMALFPGEPRSNAHGPASSRS